MKTPDEKMTDAVNLLCKTCDRKLPEGYQVSLVMAQEEYSISLESPDGDDIPIEGYYESNPIDEAIDTARAHKREADA